MCKIQMGVPCTPIETIPQIPLTLDFLFRISFILNRVQKYYIPKNMLIQVFVKIYIQKKPLWAL